MTQRSTVLVSSTEDDHNQMKYLFKIPVATSRSKGNLELLVKREETKKKNFARE